MRRLMLLMLLLAIQEMALSSAQTSLPEYQEVWRLPSGCTEDGPFILQFEFDSSGQYLATMDDSCVINIWNLSTRMVDRSFPVSEEEIRFVQALKWSADSRFIAINQNRTPIIIYDAQTGEQVYQLERSGFPTIDWHPIENLLAVRNGLFNADTGELTEFDYSVWEFGGYWSPDGTMLASPSGYEYPYMPLFTSDGELIDVFMGLESEVAWSPDSTRLASSLQIRDIATAMPITIIPELYRIVRWHPQGDWVVGDFDHFIHFWDVDTGEQVYSIEVENCDYFNGLEISSDGQYIAVHCILFDPLHRNPPHESFVVLERVP